MANIITRVSERENARKWHWEWEVWDAEDPESRKSGEAEDRGTAVLEATHAAAMMNVAPLGGPLDSTQNEGTAASQVDSVAVTSAPMDDA
jgi:hypothetical protein